MVKVFLLSLFQYVLGFREVPRAVITTLNRILVLYLSRLNLAAYDVIAHLEDPARTHHTYN